MNIIETKLALQNKVKELNILTPNERWESGKDHHNKSKILYDSISAMDLVFSDDYFCWKSGGDGDNGEELMYELDMIFELEDLGYTISSKAWKN